MNRDNTSSDWSVYNTRCDHCGTSHHASEGGCPCRDDWETCSACNDATDPDEMLFGSDVCHGCHDMRTEAFVAEMDDLLVAIRGSAYAIDVDVHAKHEWQREAFAAERGESRTKTHVMANQREEFTRTRLTLSDGPLVELTVYGLIRDRVKP